MPGLPFALFDAFSDVAFGGSQAVVVSDSGGIDAGSRRRIAKEMGMPATGFVDSCEGNVIQAQFFSTVTELPMCGHGTICLITRMVELGLLDWAGGGVIDVELRLPRGTAAVEVSRLPDDRPMVMLAIEPPVFTSAELDLDRLAVLLGVTTDIYCSDKPVEVARGDFIHLVLPVANLKAMHRIAPDFAGLTKFCHEHGLETVAAFSTEVERPKSMLHVRDFCPAVGVAESAAAGTTNAALASYLIRHGMVEKNSDGTIVVQAEQGIEIGRPSTIRSCVTMDGDSISRLQVGGVATRVMDGRLHVPDKPASNTPVADP